MKALVGLGNPGSEYSGTRHNLGFELADRVAARARAGRFARSSRSLIASGRLCGQELAVVKPQTYMNLSGLAVADFVRQSGVAGEDLIVAHDDLDIDLGALRVKLGGGHGGHRGLESILAELGASDFVRIRLGIRPAEARGDAADYVLRPFEADERELVDRVLAEALKAVEALLAVGVKRAMNEFNRRQESA